MLIPLWAGILALPFTGPAASFKVAAAAGFLVFLGRMSGHGLFSRALIRFRKKMSPYRARSARMLAAAQSSRLFLIVVVLLLVIFPLFLNDYFRDVMTLTGMYIVLALGLNLVVGQAGLLNLGYVAFYAIGAYTYAILSTSFGISFWPGLALGALSAGVFSALIGLPTLKLRGDYFAIVTLGLGEITRIVLNNWDAMTGGPNGISRIGRPVIRLYPAIHSGLLLPDPRNAHCNDFCHEPADQLAYRPGLGCDS